MRSKELNLSRKAADAYRHQGWLNLVDGFMTFISLGQKSQLYIYICACVCILFFYAFGRPMTVGNEWMNQENISANRFKRFPSVLNSIN